MRGAYTKSARLASPARAPRHTGELLAAVFRHPSRAQRHPEPSAELPLSGGRPAACQSVEKGDWLRGKPLSRQRQRGFQRRRYPSSTDTYTHPRSLQAWATRAIAMLYAASRMYSFRLRARSATSWKAEVIITSSLPSTSSFSQK